MKNTRELRAIDFFCGAGGLTYGLASAGIKVLAGIDIDKECKDTYEKNNRGSKFIRADVRKLTPQKLEKRLKIKPNDDCMLFAGCSPCQYWTQIHTQKGKSLETKYLLGDFLKLIKYFKPGYVIVENVEGILSHKDESKLTELLDFLDRNKYAYDYDKINAMYYGIPQRRKRFLLVASRIGKGIKLPQADKEHILKVRDVLGADKGFPSIGAGHVDNTDFLHTTADLSDKNIKRLKLTPHDGGTRLNWKDNPELQINAYKGKDKTFSDTYGRMFWDIPSPTITTKFHSISNGRFAHPTEDRGISLREGATLQSFPRTYIFRGNGIGSIARQIGNAVPPELAGRVGIVIISHHQRSECNGRRQ